MRARWTRADPNTASSPRARRTKKCAECSQVKPTPPCSWTVSCAARMTASVQVAPATAAASPADGRVLVPCGRGVASRGPRPLEIDQQVGETMLDDLEGGKRTPELVPLLDVRAGHLEHRVDHPDLLGCQRDRGESGEVRHHGGQVFGTGDQVGGRRVEVDASLPAGQVQDLESGALWRRRSSRRSTTYSDCSPASVAAATTRSAAVSP